MGRLTPPTAGPDHRTAPARIAGIYLVFSLAWIWLSDLFLIRLGIQGELSFWAAAAKGSAFVFLSAAALYLLVRREVRALARALALLRAVADGTTDAVFVKDRDGKYLLFNEAAARFVGKPVAEVLGRDDTELFDAKSAALVMAQDRRVLETDRPTTHEEELTAAGVTRTYMATKAPYRDETGTVMGTVGISRDISDRKRAEQESRASREKYEQLVANVDGIVWEVDARTLRFTFVSKQAERLLGFPVERWTTDAEFWANQIHPDDRTWAVEYCLSATRALENHDFEYRMLAADGRVVWLRDIVTVTADHGEPKTLRGIMVDMTAQKRAAEYLTRQNAVLERIAAGAPLPDVLTELVRMVEEQLSGVVGSVLLLDRDGRLRAGAGPNLPAEYNAAIDGVAIGPCVGSCGTAAYTRQWVLVNDIATDPLWADYRALALAHGLRACWSAPILAAPRGAAPPVLGTFAVYARTAGPPDPRLAELIARAEHVARVAIESDRAERDLRESEEQLRIFTDNVWAPIAMLDHDMRYIHTSRRWLTDYKLGAPSVIGRTHYEVFPEIPERWKEIHRRCLAGAVERCEEDRFERADGTVQWLRWEIQPWRRADGAVGGLVMFTEDITARKRMEAQLQQAQKMEAVGRLAGGIAHDFNNLLTVINGYSDFVFRDLPPGDSHREPLAHVREAGERAARLTQQLLAYSRKAMVEPKVLDLNEIVSESARLLRRLVGEDVALTTDLAPALDRVKVDRGQIEQVVMNLVVNARDAMPHGGRIAVETRNVFLTPADLPDDPDLRPGRYVRLTVSDTGAGMTEEVKARLFEPFFTTKEIGKGTGLGLAVAQGAVKQNGGHIGVASAPGAGTTFTVLLPAAEEVPPPSALLRRPARGTETILLVEDEDAVRAVARIGLEGEGYTVLAASSGAEALATAAGHARPVDLLVTDVVMPHMGGRQVAEALRARQPGLRVLYMSGYTDDTILRHGLAEATDEFLQKPFTPVALARKVREVLDAGA